MAEFVTLSDIPNGKKSEISENSNTTPRSQSVTVSGKRVQSLNVYQGPMVKILFDSGFPGHRSLQMIANKTFTHDRIAVLPNDSIEKDYDMSASGLYLEFTDVTGDFKNLFSLPNWSLVRFAAGESQSNMSELVFDQPIRCGANYSVIEDHLGVAYLISGQEPNEEQSVIYENAMRLIYDYSGPGILIVDYDFYVQGYGNTFLEFVFRP